MPLLVCLGWWFRSANFKDLGSESQAKYKLQCTRQPIRSSIARPSVFKANMSELMPEQSDHKFSSNDFSTRSDGKKPLLCNTLTICNAHAGFCGRGPSRGGRVQSKGCSDIGSIQLPGSQHTGFSVTVSAAPPAASPWLGHKSLPCCGSTDAAADGLRLGHRSWPGGG